IDDRPTGDMSLLLSFVWSLHTRSLHSFPTRRSSDLSRSLSAGTKSAYAWRWAPGKVTRLISCCAREWDSLLQALRSAWQAHLPRSEEHTSELQSHLNIVCRLLLEKKKLYNTEKLHLS